ncbi:MAG: 16S rRNA processing protein RimM [Bacteroidota bacterium]
METIPKADCEKIGFFRKTHGVHGEVILEFESHFEFSVEEADRFFVELEGLLVPFFVSEDGFRFKSSKTAIIKLDDVNTENYARRLVRNSAWLFKEEIIDTPEESELLLEGFMLIDEKSGEIGLINQVDDFSGNIVLTVQYRGEEIMVPYNDEMLVSLDEKQKTIKLRLPEGLLEE